MKYTIPLATAFAVWMGAAHADEFTDKIVTNLQDLGYDYIEIKNGPSQVKVEAIRGTEELEVIYDRLTGEILKQEIESTEGDDIGQSGVDISNRNRDFLDDDDDGRDDDDDDNDDDYDDDDEDDDDDSDDD
ncbi:MAG: PepSY domain-containing protein [Boseongicola sp.]|nr:PepSY domain-containing protein [Boseongicola sp.]